MSNIFKRLQVVDDSVDQPRGTYARWTLANFSNEHWANDLSKTHPRLQIVEQRSDGSTRIRSPEWHALRAHGFKVPRGYSIHHIDGRRLDIQLDNLAVMPKVRHAHLHALMRNGREWFDADPEGLRQSVRNICASMPTELRRRRLAINIARNLDPAITAYLGVPELDAGERNADFIGQLRPEVQRCIALHRTMLRAVQHLLDKHGLPF